MRFFHYLVFFCSFITNANAQQIHYIYIQTENKQVFYIKMNEKVFSSTASGYVIIPKLTNGTYKLNIGFPKNEWPSQTIDVTVTDKDMGFLLKNFTDKGWGLFNIQTMDLVMNSGSNTAITQPPENKTDAFSNTLAEVTNTPSIRQQDPVKDTIAAVTTDTAGLVVKEEIKKEDTAIALATKKISQVFSVIDNTGRSIIYAVDDGSNTDSIRIFIPYDKKEIPDAPKDSVAIVKADVKEDKKILDTSVNTPVPDSIVKKDSTENNLPQVKNDIQKPVENKPLITDIKVTDPNTANQNDYKVTIINPACTSVAANDDFLKLRKKMAARENDEDMIEAAKKAFKSKCFTTQQVKDLSVLFLKDEGKYNFYDAAYSHVSDIGNFKELQSQLSEEYFITRFKAMLR